MTKSDILSYVSAMALRLESTPDFSVVMEEPAPGIVVVRTENYPATKASFDLERHRVTADTGSRQDGTGALNELLNNPTLVRNATYWLDGHIFIKTDVLGRPYKYRVFYNKNWSVVHSQRPSNYPDKCFRDGDQAGHVIAASLYAPHELINVVPMPLELNEKWYRFQDVYLASALRELEKSEDDWLIELHIDVCYSANSLRPDSIRLSADIDNARGYSASLSTECIY